MKRSTLGWLILGGTAVTFFFFRSRIAEAVQDWEVRIILGRISPYNTILIHHSARNFLDENLVKAIIWRESSGFPNVSRWEEPLQCYSYGLIGITYTTAQQMGFTGNPGGLFDPDTNVRYGTDYLRWQLDRYSEDVRKAVSAYNAGTYTETNKAYVDRVLEYLSRLEKA